MVLPRLDIPPNIPEPVTVAENIIVTPDPFRDVIRTEPAPNLQSLMGDMGQYLARQTTTTQRPTVMTQRSTQTATTTTQSTRTTEENESFFDVFKYLFSDDVTDHNKENKDENSTNTTPESTTTKILTTISPTTPKISTTAEPKLDETKNIVDPIGILKLAGCNIYGRMYRVGRIISELSGPCRECKCTEIGVQCRNLAC